MSEYHVKFIASDNGGPRYEHVIKSYEGVAAEEGFEVFSALFGDGKGRYEDVTDIVREWGRSWPENWEEVLYATRKPRLVPVIDTTVFRDRAGDSQLDSQTGTEVGGLVIHQAHYGIGSLEDIDVRERLQNIAYLNKDSLDIIVNNSTLTPNQNPFRGKKKQLNITYSINGGDVVTRTVEEKDWLIIGPVRQGENLTHLTSYSGNRIKDAVVEIPVPSNTQEGDLLVGFVKPLGPMSATALNDYLIRKFSISPQRLRGPMPIELRDFHRDDLAQLFAELGFNYGVEVGVAEANYSSVLMKANPTMKLLLVDPWHHYSANPQGKSKEKHEYAYNEAKRKMADYHNVEFLAVPSMTAVQTVDDESMDFCYIDGNHLFDYVMQDLIEWSKRVRSGGIISGDDWYQLDQKRWIGGGVVEAVQAYTNAHRIPVWYIFQGHKSVDFMWVRP